MSIMVKIQEAMINVHMAACFPQNDLLTKPILPAFDLLVGGVAGFMVKIGVVTVLVVIAVIALVKIVRQRDAKEEIGKMVWVVLIIPALVLILIIGTTVLNSLISLC